MRLQPLLTADETRRAEEAQQGSLEELMERAGAAVAEIVLRQFPGRVAVVCGRATTAATASVCARVLRDAGRDVTVVDGVRRARRAGRDRRCAARDRAAATRRARTPRA